MAEFVGFVRVVQLEAKRDGLLHDFCIDTSLEGLGCIFALLSQSLFKSLISIELQIVKYVSFRAESIVFSRMIPDYTFRT